MRHPRILLIVGEDIPRERLMTALKDAGHRVHGVERGRDGLEAVAGGDVGVVLCSLDLPDMSGFDVLGQLRMQRSTLTLPVILLAAAPHLDVMRRCLKLGADDLLPVTADHPVLTDAVEQALAASRHSTAHDLRAHVTPWLDDHHEQIARHLVEQVQLPLYNLRTLTAGARRLADNPILSMIDNIDALIDKTLSTVDLLLIDIFPVKIEQLGLMPALYLLAERYRETAPHPVRLAVTDADISAMPALAQQTTLLLILRDLLAHYIRVIRAASIKLQLHTVDGQIGYDLLINDIPGDADPEADRKSVV